MDDVFKFGGKVVKWRAQLRAQLDALGEPSEMLSLTADQERLLGEAFRNSVEFVGDFDDDKPEPAAPAVPRHRNDEARGEESADRGFPVRGEDSTC